MRQDMLAAEAAIGRNPANCVRVLSNLINEVKNKPDKISQNSFLKILQVRS